MRVAEYILSFAPLYFVAILLASFALASVQLSLPRFT